MFGAGFTPSGSPPSIKARVTTTTAQTIANGVVTSLQFTIKLFDTGNFFKAIDAFTIPVTGYYSFSCGMTWSPSAGGGRRFLAPIVNRGLASEIVLSQNELPPNATAYISHSVALSCVFFNAGDILQSFCYQDSGGSLNTYAALAPLAYYAHMEIKSEN